MKQISYGLLGLVQASQNTLPGNYKSCSCDLRTANLKKFPFIL